MPVGWTAYPRSILPDSHWAALHGAVQVLMDEILMDLEGWSEDDTFAVSGAICDLLPPIHRTRYSKGFVHQFLACVASVGLKLQLPGYHSLGCIAEELALHLIVRYAEEQLESEDIEADFDDWPELAFEDSDFELLYDPKLDGIETDEELSRRMGFAHLAFADWFKPFSSAYVHPFVSDQNSLLDPELYEPEQPSRTR